MLTVACQPKRAWKACRPLPGTPEVLRWRGWRAVDHLYALHDPKDHVLSIFRNTSASTYVNHPGLHQSMFTQTSMALAARPQIFGAGLSSLSALPTTPPSSLAFDSSRSPRRPPSYATASRSRRCSLSRSFPSACSHWARRTCCWRCC